MRTIWKFPLEFATKQQIPIPSTSKVVHVGEQAGVVTLWVDLYGTHAIADGRFFGIFGTGHQIPETATYIGTVEAQSGLVWHVYEVDA